MSCQLRLLLKTNFSAGIHIFIHILFLIFNNKYMGNLRFCSFKNFRKLITE